LDAGGNRHALGPALGGKTLYRRQVEGEAALPYVQANGDAAYAPVREERPHVTADLGGAEDELGAVADPLLPFVRRDQIRLLHAGAECDVADGVVVVGGGVGLPHLHA